MKETMKRIKIAEIRINDALTQSYLLSSGQPSFFALAMSFRRFSRTFLIIFTAIVFSSIWCHSLLQFLLSLFLVLARTERMVVNAICFYFVAFQRLKPTAKKNMKWNETKQSWFSLRAYSAAVLRFSRSLSIKIHYLRSTFVTRSQHQAVYTFRFVKQIDPHTMLLAHAKKSTELSVVWQALHCLRNNDHHFPFTFSSLIFHVNLLVTIQHLCVCVFYANVSCQPSSFRRWTRKRWLSCS